MDKIISNIKRPSGYNCSEYINEITDSLNEFLCDEHKDLIKYSGKNCGTYIQDSDNGYFAIRVPGATRGHIRVENNIITEIKFYEPTKRCYRDGYEEAIKKYIGYKWTYCSDKMKNLFECKANKAGYCGFWLRACVGGCNCEQGYCVYCVNAALSPKVPSVCDECIQFKWKKENYIKD